MLAFYLSVSTPQYFLLQSQKLKTRIVGTKVGLMTTFAAAADFFFHFSFGTTPIRKWTSKFINGFIFNQSSKW